jgi:hypothetical protein
MRDEDEEAGESATAAGGDAPDRSLLEDVETAIDDGRTYLEAELAYQKTRAVFIADRAKDAAVFAAIGGSLAVLALVALTVGLVIALVPYLTAWGATLAVTVLWLALGAVFIRMAARRWRWLIGAFLEKDRDE